MGSREQSRCFQTFNWGCFKMRGILKLLREKLKLVYLMVSCGKFYPIVLQDSSLLLACLLACLLHDKTIIKEINTSFLSSVVKFESNSMISFRNFSLTVASSSHSVRKCSSFHIFSTTIALIQRGKLYSFIDLSI